MENSSFAFDHLELWVGNAKQAAYYYAHAFGFTPVAYSGPETGRADRTSYVLAQHDLRLVLTSGLHPDDAIGAFVARHGDGVRDVAMRVDDVDAVYARAVAGGAVPIAEPATLRDEFGTLRIAAIAAYGDVVHTFLAREAYRGVWLPGFRPLVGAAAARGAGSGLVRIDHCVANVGWGEMDGWCDFYARTLGFTPLVSFDDHDISTEYTALRSQVMQSHGGGVKLPINEPAHGKKRSQIEEYLDFNAGPGVQHVALATDDIVATVRMLRAKGVELLAAPGAYYDELSARVGAIREELEELRELDILVDRDDAGYMLQIFTKPVNDRPTLFFEIIQRRGSLSFGKGNFKALFVSIEQEQAKRGTL